MKTIWKWILGIVLVLVVVGALVAVPLVMRNYALANVEQRAVIQQQDRPGRGSDDWQGPGYGRMGPGMMGRGGYSRFGGVPPFGMGFMMAGMFVRGLIPLALFGLLLWGAYTYGRRSLVRTTTPAPAAESPVPPHACAKCGASVQDGWKHCPECGKKQ
jgi:hypothetical protein